MTERYWNEPNFAALPFGFGLQLSSEIQDPMLSQPSLKASETLKVSVSPNTDARKADEVVQLIRQKAGSSSAPCANSKPSAA